MGAEAKDVEAQFLEEESLENGIDEDRVEKHRGEVASAMDLPSANLCGRGESEREREREERIWLWKHVRKEKRKMSRVDGHMFMDCHVD